MDNSLVLSHDSLLSQTTQINSFPDIQTPRPDLTEAANQWSHPFRPSLLNQSTPPPTKDPLNMSGIFTYCQKQLLCSSQDLSKTVQHVSDAFTDHKIALEALNGETKALIESLRTDNMARLDGIKRDGVSFDSP